MRGIRRTLYIQVPPAPSSEPCICQENLRYGGPSSVRCDVRKPGLLCLPMSSSEGAGRRPRTLWVEPAARSYQGAAHAGLTFALGPGASQEKGSSDREAAWRSGFLRAMIYIVPCDFGVQTDGIPISPQDAASPHRKGFFSKVRKL